MMMTDGWRCVHDDGTEHLLEPDVDGWVTACPGKAPKPPRKDLDVGRALLVVLCLFVILASLVLALTRPAFDGGVLLALMLIGLAGAGIIRLAYGPKP